MVMSLYRTIKGSTSGTYKRRRERSLGPLETLPREMVSRRKILSRSRDDLNLDQAYAHQQEEEEDVWYQKDKLYKEHIQEVLDKWTQIDDEIWAKVIVFERNRRVAKAYARAPVLTINGSDDGFDGMRIGLCGFDNPMRDQKTDEIKRLVSQGVKIKMDDAGNILIRRYSKSNVYIKSTACAPNEETAIGADIMKLPNQALESEKIVKLFDMKKFQSNVNRELRRAYPDRRRLETQCLSAVAFVKSENEILDCPVWVLIVNVVAMDMLKSKLPPVQRPVDIKNRPRIPIPDEDPYSVAGNGGGSSGSSGFGTNGVGSPGHVAATREQLLLQTQQLAQRRSEKPPKLPPRDNLYPHDIPKPDYDDILEDDARGKAFRGKSDKGKDKQKYDDPYYCGLRARVPNFVKTSNGKLPKEIITKESNNNNNSTIQSSAGSKHRMSVSHLQHPASLSSLHQLHQQPIHPAALMAAHQHHLQHQQAQQQMMWHARSYESGIGIYSHLKYMLETFPQPPPPPSSQQQQQPLTGANPASAGGANLTSDNHMTFNHNEIIDEHLLADEDDTDMTDETTMTMPHDNSGCGGDAEVAALTTNIKDRKGQQKMTKMTTTTTQTSQTKQNKTTTSRTSQSVVSNKIKKSKLIATNSNNNLNNPNNPNNSKVERDGGDDDDEDDDDSFYRGVPVPNQRQPYHHPYYNNPQKNYPNYLYPGRYPPPFDPYDPQQPASLDYVQPVPSNYGVAPSVTSDTNHPNRWHSESDIFYYNKYHPVNMAAAAKAPKPTAMDVGSWDSGDEYSADSIDRSLLPNQSQVPVNPIKQLRGRARRDIIFPFDDENSANQQVPVNTQSFNRDGFDRKVTGRLSLRQADEEQRRIERTNDGRFSFRFLHPEAREFQRAGANRYSFSHLDRRAHYMPFQAKQNIVRKVSQPATIREEEKHFIYQKLPQKSMSSESVLISSTCFGADLPIDEHYRQQKLKIDEHLEMLVKKESGAAVAATSTLSSTATNAQQPKISKSRLTLMFARRIVAAASGRSSSKERKAAENARKKLVISSPLPLQTELVGEKATRILGADFIASAAATAANNKKLSHPLTTVQALQSITTQNIGVATGVASASSNSNGTTSSSVSSSSQKTNSTQPNSHRHHHHHHHHHKHQSRPAENSVLIKSAANT